MEDYFREYIASDEPINTREKKFILELHDLTVTWNKDLYSTTHVYKSLHGNKKILIKIDNTRLVHRSKDARDVNAPSF